MNLFGKHPCNGNKNLIVGIPEVTVFSDFSLIGLVLGPHPWQMEVPRLGVESEL